MLLRRLLPVGFLLALALPVLAQAPAKASATEELTALLHHFLDAAGRNDKAVFDHFWAEDVLYTGSGGRFVTKADIMKSLDEPAKPGAPQETYGADQITVHDYGNFAVVAFRLVQNLVNPDGSKETQYYRNTGTFQERNGRWQAVAWQATKLPEEAATTTPYPPKEGFVPNEEAAIGIAQAVWKPVYGESKVRSEMPFHASRKGDVWEVTGTLHCPGGATSCVGGVMGARISRFDGRVLSIWHEK